ncbi:MAG: HIT domain-containing protein [Gammaproteobacteria bacterium]|nr:HIT domain-containing protein [Gammaproteobacteria bacterium]
MSDTTLFAKIIAKELPSDMLYQDELVTAFRDINPAKPTHVLIVPNRVIPTVDDVEPSDEAAMGRMLSVARTIAREEGISDSGYRLVINVKEHGRQEVPHLHMHLLGGEDVGPMLVRKPST